MNIQKIYEALRQDNQNSALGIITEELETQGYKVMINTVPVDSRGIFEGNYSNLENKMEPLDIALYKDDSLEQKFCLEFVDFHEFIIKPAQER